MAENIRLETTVSMNTRPLERNITTAQAKLKAMNKSLRDQSKHFKQAGEDADGLAAREEALTEAMDEQNVMIAEKEKALAKVKSEIKDTTAMTNKEIKAMERARAEVSKAKYELRSYETDMRKTRASIIKFNDSTLDMSKNMDSLSIKSARVASEYRKQGDEVGALKAEYDGLGEQIDIHNKKIEKEEATLKKIGSTINETGKEYNEQQIHITKLNNEHIKLMKNYDKLGVSLTKAREESDLHSRGMILSYLATTRLSGGIERSERAWKGFTNTMHKASATINRLGSTFRNIGLVIGGMALGGLIQNISTLVPLAGSLVSVFAGLGGVLTAVGGGAIGMGGAFGIAGVAVKLFAGQAQTALQMVEDGEMKATAELDRYKTSLSGLQTQWKGVVQGNQAAIFNTMANGINIARFALTTLNPFITKTANQISKFSGRMRTWVTESNNARGAFSMLNKIGPPIFQNILNAVFKVTDGLTHMLTQFAPLFTWTAAGLEKIANEFNKWANSASTDKGIASFIEYTKRNLPVAGMIFGNTFSGIIGLFQAFAGHSEVVMRGMAGVTNTFKEWGQNLSSTEGFKNFIAYLETNGPKVWEVLKNIGSAIVGMIRGLAPIGALMLDMLVPLTELFAQIAKYPVFGAFLGVLAAFVGIVMQLAPVVIMIYQLVAAIGGLAGIAAVITSPVTWIIAGLVALGAALVIAYQKSETFRNIVDRAFKGVVIAFQFLWDGIKFIGSAIGNFMGSLFTPIVAFSKSIINTLRTFWTQNGAMIIQAIRNIWMVVGPALGMIWTVAQPILMAFGQSFLAFWNFIKLQFTNIWNMIKGIFSGVLNVILGLVKIFGGVFTGNWSAIWSGLGQVVMGLLGIILAPIKFLFGTIRNTLGLFGSVIKAVWFGIWGALKGIVVSVLTGISSFIRWILNGLKAFFSWVWNGIKNIVMWAVNGISNVVRVVFNAVVAFIKWVWGGVKTFFSWIWNGIKNTITWAINGISNIVRVIFTAVVNFIKWIWNGIASFFTWLWNSKIGGAFRWGIQAINVVVRTIFAAIGTFIRWIWNGIASFFKWVWNGIKNTVVGFVTRIWNNIKTNWNNISRATTMVFNAVKNFLIWVWTIIRNKVVAFARSLWSKVSSVWNTVSRVTRNIFNSIKNFLIWLWTTIRDRVVGFARSLWSKVNGVWNTISKVTRNIFNSIKNFLIWLWTTVRDKVVGFVSSLWSKVSGTWNKLSGGTKKIFNAVRNYLVDKWEGIKDKVTGIASSLWGAVKDTFTNMKDGIKGLAGKIGDTITGMVKGIKDGLNALIKGVNWVAKKLGVDEKIPELSTGTAGATSAPTSGIGMGAGVSNGAISSGGFATVNDKGPGNGTGSNGHQEVIQRANGQMFAPKGKDVTVPLQKGDIVHNGKSVQRAQQAGVLPKFSTGTKKKKKYDLLRQQKKHGEHGMDGIGSNISKSAWGPTGGGAWDDIKGVGDVIAASSKSAAKKTIKGAAEGTKKVKEAAGAAGGWAKDKAGDLLDWVGKPMKLVDKILEEFGVDFPNVKGQIPKDMMWNPMWKGLKGGVKSLFDGWLTEADSAGGDGGYIDLSHGINFGFGSPPGYPFGRHDGLDIGYPYGSKLYSTLKGKGTAKSGWNGGFGNSMWLKDGNMQAIYGHMSDLAWSGTKNVKPGTYLGKSGGDPARQGAGAGQSTGPHLHYEMRKNGKPFDPTNWLKTNNGSKGAGKWKNTVKKALKTAGLPTGAKYVNAWLKQIDTESSGNEKAMGGTDGLADGRAQGLVQVKPGTFNAYKMKGHGNIMKGLDNLIAGMRYADAKYGNAGLSQIGKGKGYATGTNFASSGIANVFEKGGEIMNLRGGEQIIPNDVSIAAIKQMMNSNIFDKTQSAVYNAISNYADALRNKEESKRVRELQAQQNANANSNDIKELKNMFENMLYLMQQQLGVQEDIAQSSRASANKSNVIDVEKTTKATSEQEAFNLLMSNYNSGLSRR